MTVEVELESSEPARVLRTRRQTKLFDQTHTRGSLEPKARRLLRVELVTVRQTVGMHRGREAEQASPLATPPKPMIRCIPPEAIRPPQ